jgi:hypothetical protein
LTGVCAGLDSAVGIKAPNPLPSPRLAIPFSDRIELLGDLAVGNGA